MLSYGYRSKCCIAPIHVGFKKIKNSKLRIKIWICNSCGKRDVDIVEYNKALTLGTSHSNTKTQQFVDPDEISDPLLIEE